MIFFQRVDLCYIKLTIPKNLQKISQQKGSCGGSQPPPRAMGIPYFLNFLIFHLFRFLLHVTITFESHAFSTKSVHWLAGWLVGWLFSWSYNQCVGWSVSLLLFGIFRTVLLHYHCHCNTYT